MDPSCRYALVMRVDAAVLELGARVLAGDERAAEDAEAMAELLEAR